MKIELYLTQYTKSTQNVFKELNIRLETTKLPQERKKEKF